MFSIHILICDSGFEAGGTQVPSNIAPWTIVGQESAILLQTQLSSCFERNKVALKMDVRCDNCPFDGVGVSHPGFWGMVRIINNVSHMNSYFYVPFPSFYMIASYLKLTLHLFPRSKHYFFMKLLFLFCLN